MVGNNFSWEEDREQSSARRQSGMKSCGAGTALLKCQREREQFITRVGALFDKELFLDSPFDDLRQPMAALHRQCRKIFGAYAKRV